MLIKIPYDKTKVADFEAKRAEHEAAGKVLTEVQNHETGDFLVFGDPPPLTLEERVTALEASVAALEKKP